MLTSNTDLNYAIKRVTFIITAYNFTYDDY